MKSVRLFKKKMVYIDLQSREFGRGLRQALTIKYVLLDAPLGSSRRTQNVMVEMLFIVSIRLSLQVLMPSRANVEESKT
jgi:hypothetical protein